MTCLWCHGYVKPPKLFCCDECHRQWQQRMAGLKWKEHILHAQEMLPTNQPLNQE